MNNKELLYTKESTLPCYGNVPLDEETREILRFGPFQKLKNKTQLGTKVFSIVHPNCYHTRLQHSIGTYYLTGKVVDICRVKFSKYFTITDEQKKTLQLSALCHDLGHGPFSHSLEDKGEKTHEQRTIEIIKEYSEQINEIYGFNISVDVIRILENNMSAKEVGKDFQFDNNVDILFVFTSLLIGSVDCDRIEYLTTDSFLVYGRVVDFTKIFDYITIVMVKDVPKVGFEEQAIPYIENLLITRFNMYKKLYYDADSVLTELALKEYKKVMGWGEKEMENLNEFDIYSLLNKELSNPGKHNLKRRLAEIIMKDERKNLMFKTFEDESEYQFFMKKLEFVVKDLSIVRTCTKCASIYNKKKNQVYIQDNDGVVHDITQISPVVRDYFVKISYVLVDIDPIIDQDSKKAELIKELFNDNKVEIEKKFLYSDLACKEHVNIANSVKQIESILPEAKFSKWITVQNEDQYFESDQLPKSYAIRHRYTENESCYYIKVNIDDGTSITKRLEQKINCRTQAEFTEMVTKYIKDDGYPVDAPIKINDGIKITTIRNKSLMQYKGSIIEVAYDYSVYQYMNKASSGFMVEFELKQGEEISLWFLTQCLIKNGFIETNESKQTRAKKTLKIK